MQASIELRGNDRTLRGMLSSPAANDFSKFPIVIMFPGIDGTHVGPQRLFHLLARDLECIGVASLRMDLTGQGDSDGEFEDITPATHTEDARVVLQYVSSDPMFDQGKIIVLGISNGALTATGCAVNGICSINDIILLSPTFNISQMAKKILSQIPNDRSQVNLYGNLTTRESMWGFYNYDIEAEFSVYHGNTLLITGSRDALVPQDVFHDFKQRVLNHPWTHYQIEGAGHLFEHVDWQREVRRLVVEYIQTV